MFSPLRKLRITLKPRHSANHVFWHALCSLLTKQLTRTRHWFNKATLIIKLSVNSIYV